MSFHRENVTWQSSNNKWNLGFFQANEGDQDYYDYGFEADVDVEYNYNAFEWAAIGYDSKEEALRSFYGETPINGRVLSFKDHEADCEEYDRMAQWLLDPSVKNNFKAHERYKEIKKHFAALAEDFDNNEHYENQEVAVFVKIDGEPHDKTGPINIITGPMQESGSWLYVQDQPVYNKRTNRFHNYIHKIELLKNNFKKS